MSSSGSSVIVCFGDSLTAGFQSPTPLHPGGEETPYGAFLQEWLGPAVQVYISGICGELTGEMAMRFRRDVLARHPQYVIILGGTNDLGWNGQPPEIMRNLVKMYENAMAEHITPVLVTVPSVRIETAGSPDGMAWVEDHLRRRDQLNGLIRQYGARKGVPCVDLFAATADAQSRQLAPQYSNDGLHLTTMGYRRLAELLFDQVFAAAFPQSPGRPR